MASVTVLRRATSKTNTTSVLESDTILVGGLGLSAAGTGSLYADNNTTAVSLGTGTASATITVGGSGTTTMNLGTTMPANSSINLGAAGMVTVINGDLHVKGTATSVDSSIVNTGDNSIYLNDLYTTAVGKAGGIVVNYLPTATATTVAATGFVAGVPATSNPTVKTVGSGTFSVGDLVQISGANNIENNGLFEVLSHITTTLTIRGVGTLAATFNWTQNQFVADTTVAGSITKVTVAVFEANASTGVWETGAGSSTTGFTFSSITSTSSITLQQAYAGSGTPATLTTNNTNKEVLITGTAGLVITGTGANNSGVGSAAANGGFIVNTTGFYSLEATTASTIDVTGAGLTVSTTTSGALAITSAGTLAENAVGAVTINSSGASIGIGNNANAFAINVGTGAAARTITIGNQTGATALTLDAGTGSVLIATGAQARTVSIATGAAVQTVTIGSTNSTSSMQIDSGTGSILIGTGGQARTVSVGTGAAVQTVTVGSQNSTSSLTLDSGTGTIGIGTGAQARTISVGTGGAAQTITVGSSTAGSTLALTAGSSTNDITFTARGATAITLNQANFTDGGLTVQGGALSGFTATSIVGALNELKATDDPAAIDLYTTTGRTIGQAVVIDGNASANTAANGTTLAGCSAFVGLVKTVATPGEVITNGPGVAIFEAGSATPAAGAPVYLSSATAGRVTGTAPTGAVGSGVAVYQIGIVKDTTSGSGGTGLTAGTVGANETCAVVVQPMLPTTI